MIRTAALMCAFALCGSAASAAGIFVKSVVGVWDVETVKAERGDPNARVEGEFTDTITWGESFTGTGGKSGFGFTGTAAGQTFAANTSFDVGVFTHFNRVIYKTEHVETARLNLTVEAEFDGMVKTFTTSYLFSLWETPNDDDPCANGAANGIADTVNQNGCADRVQILENDSLSDEFTHNGRKYEFDLFGFEGGKEFWTIESLANTTFLKAQFRTSDILTPIPLPAGAWMLLAGVGALAAVRRRM